MRSEELQPKKKVIDPLRSDEDTDIAMEDNLMGTLLIESASVNKYKDLKRSLIKITTQGHNRHTNSKASEYITLRK